MEREKARKGNLFFRMTAPGLLLLLPLFAYPLVWCKLFTPDIPFWGDAQAVTLKVLGVCAAGALLLIPERMKKLWDIPRLRLLTVFAFAGLCVACMQHFLYGGLPEFICTAGFFFLMPLAGVVYAPELKRLFPLLALLLILPVAVVTVRSSLLTGWLGNWNWNFSLIAVISSVIFFFIPGWSVRKAFLFSVLLPVLLLTGISFFYRDLIPRGTFAGIIGATVCVLLFRNIRPARRWAFALWAGVLTIVLFVGSTGAVMENIRDSRFQLWRGSWDCILAHFPLGAGFDRFESVINPFLPEIYYFTPFAAPRHPHPHNELLSYAASYGLVGVIFFVLLLLLVLQGMRFRDRWGLWLTWSVLLLAIHGLFDVHLSIPLTGTWFLLGAGVVAGSGASHPSAAAPSLTVKGLKTAGILLLCISAGMSLVSWQANSSLRKARLMLMQKKPHEAREHLRKSLRYTSNPAALYLAGAVELFNFRDPDGAIHYLSQLKSRLGLPHHYHSNALLARACAVKGDYAASIDYFDRELVNYPFSALASGLKLSVLRQAGADSKSIIEENIRFAALMKMRGLKPEDFSKLLRNQELDDAPLKSRDEN